METSSAYMINTQTSIVFLYASNKKLENKISKPPLFTIALKIMKNLNITLTK